MASFIPLDMPDAETDNFAVKTDFPTAHKWAGKNLLSKSVCPRGGITYPTVMHEYFKDNNQYQVILDEIVEKGGDVLYLGMGLGLWAKAASPYVNLQDCVEIEAEINTLCGAVFDNVFIADANDYTPVKNYDTIVIDCFNSTGDSEEVYANSLLNLESHYAPYLKEGGQILTYNINQ